MARPRLLRLCLVLALAAPGSVLADPWKDESGHARNAWRDRGGDHRWERRDGPRDRDYRDWNDRRYGNRGDRDRRDGWRGYYPPPYGQPPYPVRAPTTTGR